MIIQSNSEPYITLIFVVNQCLLRSITGCSPPARLARSEKLLSTLHIVIDIVRCRRHHSLSLALVIVVVTNRLSMWLASFIVPVDIAHRR